MIYYFLPFVHSFFIGYYIILLLSSENDPPTITDFFLMFGVGAGATSLIIFYSLLINNKIDPPLILFISTILLIILNFSYKKTKRTPSSKKEIFLSLFKYALIFSPFIIYNCFLSIQHPYGHWDAWSFWNLTANFFLRSGEHWQNIFMFNMQASHPWLLPFNILWGWLWVGEEAYFIPILTSIIFTISTIGLLISGLSEYTKNKYALLAGLLLFSNPFFMRHSISQYADILIAYYLLATLIYILKIIYAPTKKNASIAGLLLGVLTFTKDEGILLGIIILLLFIILQFILKKNQRLLSFLKYSYKGFFLFLIPTILIKTTLPLSVTAKTFKQALEIENIFILERWTIITTFLWKNIFFNPLWGCLWTILLIWGILEIKKLLLKESSIIFYSLFIFLLNIFFIFLTSSSNLYWLLNVSSHRILFEITPSIIFYLFYTTFLKKDY